MEPGLSRSEYWDFCVDDHAAHDLPAFLDFIHELKQSELQRYSANNDVKSVDAREEIDIDVTCVAHSMGACCVLAHLVQAGLRGHPTVLIYCCYFLTRTCILIIVVVVVLFSLPRVFQELFCWHRLAITSQRRSFAN